MKTKQKIAVPILADREVFDYLKEKVGERKTKTEAFCDLLDKSLAGFVSPFLRNKGYELGRVRLVESHPAFQKRHHYHDCANQPIHGVLQWTEEVEPCRTAT